MWETAWSTEPVGKMLEMSFYFQYFFHRWSKQFPTFPQGYLASIDIYDLIQHI
jgi:hypothetical protein